MNLFDICMVASIGHMLMSALMSSVDEDHYIRQHLTNDDLKYLLGHFSQFFVNMGIIRPVEDATHCEGFTVRTVEIK